jgi:cell division protein FtsQ
MPLSNNFAARVPLVSGKIKKIAKNLPNCVGLFMTMILKKHHWIQIMPNGNLKMFNRNQLSN